VLSAAALVTRDTSQILVSVCTSVTRDYRIDRNRTVVKQGCSIGFGTGIPRVGFSHTVPDTVDTVPVQPRVRYLRVTGTVFPETRGTDGTRGFLLLFMNRLI
jgi:hypothetical protein